MGDNNALVPERRFSACRFEQSEIDAIKESVVEELNSSFDKYRVICTNNGVNEEDVGTSWISGYDVGEGIVKLIYQNNIKKLVMGAAADPHYSRRMSITSRKVKYVSENALGGCKCGSSARRNSSLRQEESADLGNPPEFSPSQGRERNDNKTEPPIYWVRRALTTLIRPSSHQLKRRSSYQPRPSRLSIMLKADCN